MNLQKTNSITYLFWLPYAAFLAGAFIYFAFPGSYILFSQEKSTLFLFTSDFFLEHFNKPGGFIVWSGKLLSSFYYYPVAGALILSLILTLIIFSISKVSNVLTRKNGSIISFLTGTCLFYINSDYRFLLFNSLGLLLIIGFFWSIVRYKSLFKGWGPVVCIPFIYYISGSFTWIFLMLTTFYFLSEVKKDMWLRLLAMWVFSLILYSLTRRFLIFQSDKTLLTYPLSLIESRPQRILFIAVSAFISILPLIFKLKFKENIISRFSIIRQRISGTIILILILFIIAIQRFDIKTKKYFLVEKLFYENKYDEVISYNTNNYTNNSLTVYLNNIALCETGKLDDQLFHFPQRADGKTLFLEWKMESEVLNLGGFFYYTAGMINEAHRWAYENMVMKGFTPEGLKMLIKTEIINANYIMAEKYIAILKKSLFYKKEAGSFEMVLASCMAGFSDNELVKIRKAKIRNDFFTLSDNPYINTEMILAVDSLNRKAFEYKMAFLLLKKNYIGILHELPRFERLGFSKLPVHIEEAAIALAISNNGKIPDTGNLPVSKNCLSEWNEYISVMRQYGNNLKTAEPVIRSRFGNTYWYYVFYR
jgi:hypothetical protein